MLLGETFQKENDLSKEFSLEIDERLILRICGTSGQGVGDSMGLERGLALFVENRSVIGEGVGFGVPAIMYSDQILFSSTATTIRNNELIKSYSIDTIQRKTWRGRFPIDSRAYRMVQGRLADVYRTDRRFRPTLTQIMHVQSLLGIRLSHERV